jgi:hypothetical protein
MTTHAVQQPAGGGSGALIWMLIARSIGLTACVAVALLAVAALLSLP